MRWRADARGRAGRRRHLGQGRDRRTRPAPLAGPPQRATDRQRRQRRRACSPRWRDAVGALAPAPNRRSPAWRSPSRALRLRARRARPSRRRQVRRARRRRPARRAARAPGARRPARSCFCNDAEAAIVAEALHGARPAVRARAGDHARRRHGRVPRRRRRDRRGRPRAVVPASSTVSRSATSGSSAG